MKPIGIVFILSALLIACTDDSGMNKYKRLVKKELGSNKKIDTIFWGIHFGMSRKDFFAYCWDMNKKGIFTDGDDGLGNMYVLYKLNNELKHPADMNFYPDFNDSTISKMRVNIQYKGWAPWNKHMYADSLLPDVLAMYKKWYSNGNPFMHINDKERGGLYVKVDGNRRITIGKYDDRFVKIDYTDLLVEKRLKK